MIAGSVSLVGFGVDSFVEVASGSALLWRMATDADAPRRDANEEKDRVAAGGDGRTRLRVGRHFKGAPSILSLIVSHDPFTPDRHVS